MSPTKLNRSLNTASVSTTPQARSGQKVNGFLTPTAPASQIRTPSDKTGGPPIKGLFSETPTSVGKKKFGTPLTNTPRHLHNTPSNTTPQLSFGATPAGGANFKELDLTNGESHCHDGNTWITVFGFPPSGKKNSQIATSIEYFSNGLL